MIGRIITPSTRPATSIVRPVEEAGPTKKGRKPRLRSSQLRTPVEVVYYNQCRQQQ
jgi:hypothetical protein